MEGRENYEQEKRTRKRQVYSAMEGMHGRRRYIGKQRESEECNGIGRRIQEEIQSGRERRSKEARSQRR